MKPLLIVLFVIFSVLHASAQYNTSNISFGDPKSNYGIEIGSGIDVPLGGLQNVYNPAPYFQASLVRYYGDFTFTAGLGYRSFRPRQSTYYYLNDTAGYSSINYTNFTSVMVFGSIAYNINLNKSTVVFGGLNFGSYYTTYGISSSSDFLTLDINGSEQEGYVAPKLGIGFKFEDIQLNVEARYNFFFTGGYVSYNSESGSASSSGTLYQSFSGGLSLVYRF